VDAGARVVDGAAGAVKDGLGWGISQNQGIACETHGPKGGAGAEEGEGQKAGDGRDEEGEAVGKDGGKEGDARQDGADEEEVKRRVPSQAMSMRNAEDKDARQGAACVASKVVVA
jgi:hypothetical protein